jgi:CheY-like chemotaxis protein
MELNMGLAIVDRPNERQIKTVLLIESDAVEAHLLAEMFNHQGPYPLALTRVECMADAETYLAGHATDVVLLDLDCSDAWGVEAVRRVRAASRGACIVLLSGQKDEATAMRAMEGGVQDYLIKGRIEPHELMQVMSKCVARRVTNDALLNDNNRAQVTLDSIGDAVICTDQGGKNDGLANEGSCRPATGRVFSDYGRIDGRNRLRSHNECNRTGPEQPSAGELHSHSTGRTSDFHRRLRRPHPRREWDGSRISFGVSRRKCSASAVGEDNSSGRTRRSHRSAESIVVD